MTDEIRPFPAREVTDSVNSAINLQNAVTRAISSVPPDRNFALIGTITRTGPQFAAFARAGHDLSFVGFLSHSPKKKWEGLAAVVWTPDF